MIIKKLLLPLLVGTSLCQVVPKEAIAIDLGEVIIRSTQDSSPYKQASQNITIIKPEQISENHSLSELLSKEAQIDISQLGAPGEDINIRMRGSDKDEVTLLLNGLPTNDALDARATLLESIPLNVIDHIEILRGPQSVLYGSNAVGGIINIITKSDGKQKEISLKSGNYGSFGESALFSHEYKNYSGVTSYERIDEKGRFANDRYGKNAVFTSHKLIFDKSDLLANFLYTETSQDIAYEALVGSSLPLPIYIAQDVDRHLNRRYLIPQASWRWHPNNWYQSLLHYGLVWQNVGIDNTSANETVLVAGTTRGSQHFRSSAQKHRLNWQNQFIPVKSDSLTNKILIGGEFTLEKLSYQDGPSPSDNTGLPIINYPDSTLNQKGTRNNYSGYFQNVTELWNKIFISLGARYDKNSTYGYSVSPRLSATYNNSRLQTRFFTGVSQGFKAPTINEYYLTLTDATGIQLKQKLATEKSHSIDIGFENNLIPKTKIGFCYFNTHYKNLIDDLALIPRAEVQGIETWATISPTKWITISANYSLTKAKNLITDTPLSQRPEHHFNSRLQIIPNKKIRFTFSTQTTSARIIPTTVSTETFGDLPLAYFETNGNAYGQSLPHYTIVNASAEYDILVKTKVVKKITASIKASNILNKHYSESPGYNSREFGLQGGLTFNF